MTIEELKKWFLRVQKAGYEKDWDTWRDERYRAQTDLFWLAKELLNYDLVDSFGCSEHLNQMAPDPVPCPICGVIMEPYGGGLSEHFSPHREMCNFFVRKNPSLNIANQDTIKNRLLIYPRGSFKSSIDEADCVQWIISFPDIRIGLLTATADLGVAFVNKVKGFFTVIEDESGERQYTKFQLLFPEHAVPSTRREPEDRFTTPARTKKIKEPSLHALSLGSTLSGWHYDVGKYDDCVSNANSGPSSSPEQRDTIRQHIDLAGSLIEPYGYHDYIGTPYDENDAYAYKIEHSSPEDLKILRRPAWELKKESKNKPLEDRTSHDYYLLFPYDGSGQDRLTYGFLRRKLREDPYIFSCQYECQPLSSRKVQFTEQLIRQQITQSSGLPQQYLCLAAWDIAFSTEKGRDYSVGSVGWFDNQERVFIVDIVRGRFNKSELAFQIAYQATKWRVDGIKIENNLGAEFLETDIRRELRKQNYECPIEFFKNDTSKNAKENRAQFLESLLSNHRLWFSAEISILDDVIQEFIKFHSLRSKRKDDIIDSLAHLCKFIPPASEPPEEEKKKQEEIWNILKEKQLYELIYGVREEEVIPEQKAESLSEWNGIPIGCSICGMPLHICSCSLIVQR